MYRPQEVNLHAQLCHPNVITLEAVLIGQELEQHKNEYYAYHFMAKMGVDFKKVLSTHKHGSLKYLRTQRKDWGLVLLNVKYILKSVLNALHYMRSQGYNYAIKCMYMN